MLYELCHGGCYNVRAFSSLIGETFFSELVLHDKTGCGTVSAAEFGRFIGTATEQLHMRQDPDRKFFYRTSRSHVYGLTGSTESSTAQPTNSDGCNTQQQNDIIRKIRLKDHEFDIPKRKEPKRKFDTVSTSRNALQKGTLGVRWERARRNDSKMLLTSKMGIDIDP
ncbi:uncharacterized protein LOC127874322 [Dreissena polymorpha]|nr:uncharacterized protein LOC127874322 [Dreissena polymorpha]